MRERSRTGRSVRRVVVEFAVSALSFWFTAWILPGISVSTWEAALVAAVVVAVLNAVIWPLVARFFSRLILWTAGLLALLAHGAILLLTSELIDELQIDSVWTAVLASIVMTIVGIVVGTLLAVDDDRVWQRRTLQRMVRRLEPPTPTDEPGILFLQIDGLAETVLRRSISDGSAPTLARWVRSGTHHITGWECDLSSQTGASQAGILHGNNENMPAFRWYDKDERRVFTSNHPRDAAEIEARQSDGHGLLAEGGSSRSNVFSGDSTDSALTFSTLLDRDRHSRYTANYILSDPYAVTRLITLSLADIGREIVDARRTRRRGIEPRLKRGGIYPLLRAATTTVLRDLTIYTLMSDIYRGVPVAYADFVGYDEVAHHSGISARTALDTLERLDEQLARLERAIGEAPRPYHVVVLSDHGQTQGATFLQRYGVTLEDHVRSLMSAGSDVAAPQVVSEGWGNLNGALTEAVSDEESRLGRVLKVATRNHIVDGDVVLGAGAEQAHGHDQVADGHDDVADADAIVLASGNLGLVSFPDVPGRATVEDLSVRHPGLVAQLASHPGIGFVLVRSAELGALAIGPAGIRYLSDDRVEGIDPLTPFGPNTADHLRRTDEFVNAPDLLINSFYDPDADEGAAFEELIGFHGGLGGGQAAPFLMYPSTFSIPDGEIVGAAAVHHLFKRWMHEMRSPEALPPWSTPPRLAAPVLPTPTDLTSLP